MTPEEIRAQLETSRRLPEEALRQAVRHADALAPAVVDVVERASAGVYLLPRQQQLLFYGLHAVAAGRVSAIYRPVMALVRLSEDRLDLLLRDDTNPRSLAYQLDRLREHVAGLGWAEGVQLVQSASVASLGTVEPSEVNGRRVSLDSYVLAVRAPLLQLTEAIVHRWFADPVDPTIVRGQ